MNFGRFFVGIAAIGALLAGTLGSTQASAAPATGVEIVKDIQPFGTTKASEWGRSADQNMVAMGGSLYFAAQSEDSDGYALWKTDGTEKNTVPVRRFSWEKHEYIVKLARAGSLLYFVIERRRPVPSGARELLKHELWRSDGTAAGTQFIVEIDKYADSGDTDTIHNLPAPRNFLAVGNTLYFAADDGLHGFELWITDGTANGTGMVTDLLTGDDRSGLVADTRMAAIGNSVYFEGSDGSPGILEGRGLWRTDGTAAGTEFVAPFGDMDHIQRFGGDRVVFIGSESWGYDFGVGWQGNNTGSELWSSDGTPAGTKIVKDITPGSGDSFSTYDGRIWKAGGSLFLNVHDDSPGSPVVLWRSDGTTDGTVPVKGVGEWTYDAYNTSHNTEPSLDYVLSQGRELNGVLLFAAPRADTAEPEFLDGLTLWRSDGTPEGTYALADTGYYLDSFVELDGFLYFFGDDLKTGEGAIWRSDGTTSGTDLLAHTGSNDLLNGYLLNGSGFSYPTVMGDQIFFSSGSGDCGRELWRTSSTVKGTASCLSNGGEPDLRNRHGLKVSVKGPSRITKGRRAKYRVSVRNSGRAVARGVKLKAIGKGIKAGKSLGRIAAKKTKIVKLKLRPKKPGKVKVSFKVTSKNAGGKTVRKRIKVKRRGKPDISVKARAKRGFGKPVQIVVSSDQRGRLKIERATLKFTSPKRLSGLKLRMQREDEFLTAGDKERIRLHLRKRSKRSFESIVTKQGYCGMKAKLTLKNRFIRARKSTRSGNQSNVDWAGITNPDLSACD